MPEWVRRQGQDNGAELSLWDASRSYHRRPLPPLPKEKVTAAGACDGAPASHPAALNFGDPVPMEAGSRISEPRGTRLRLVGRSSPPPVKICSARSHRNLPAAVGWLPWEGPFGAVREAGAGCRSRHGLLSPPQGCGPEVRFKRRSFHLFVHACTRPVGDEKASTSTHAHCLLRSVPLVLCMCVMAHILAWAREGPTLAHGFLCGIAR